MRDFIVGLLKAATERRPGATSEELQRAESELRVVLPEELVLLYAETGGADFQGDVSIHPLFATEETTGVIEQSRMPLPDGLPAEGVIRFGLRGGAEHLFAVQRVRLSGVEETPAWLSELREADWVYGVKNLDTGAIRFYRTLEALLRELVPPAQTEGFGENTFIRAFNAVQNALETATTGSHPAEAESPDKPRAKKKVAAARKASTGGARAKAPARGRRGAGAKKKTTTGSVKRAAAGKKKAVRTAKKKPSAKARNVKRPAGKKKTTTTPARRSPPRAKARGAGRSTSAKKRR